MSIKKCFPWDTIGPLLNIYKFEMHYSGIKCTQMPGRKDELCDREEGGLNTSVLMTPCWDHLFPDKRAQGWKKRIWGGGVKCLCMCALGHMSVFYLSLCTVLMWITILALPLLRILAWIRHKRQKASYLCLRVKDYLFHWMCPPIICLSLSVLFNLFLVSAQWLPLTVSPSQM